MTTYYVSSQTGSANNAGTSASAPLDSLQAAADVVKPGDTVQVMSGTYDPVTITTSGTSSAPITFEAAAGQTPVINSSGSWNGIDIQASNIVINGFTVEGDANNYNLSQAMAGYDGGNPSLNGNGIAVNSSSSVPIPNHIVIENNTVTNEPGGGIGTVGADYVQILNNNVTNNGHWSAYGASGISIYESQNSDNNAGTHDVISGNTSSGNAQMVPTGGVNNSITDGEGIILDTNTGYTGQILVQNNTVTGNGSSGIESFLTANATISGNTIYGNNTENVQPASDSAILINQSSNNTVTGNITTAPSGSTGSGTAGSGSSASSGSSSGGTTTGTGTGTSSGGGSVTDPTGGTTGSGSSASGGSSSTGGTTGTGTGTSSGSGSVSDPTGGVTGSGSSTSSGGHHHHHWGSGTTGTGTSTGGTTTVGTGASGGATAPQAPAVTIANPSLSVSPGQGVDLGVSVTLPNATDNVTVNVQGLPSYETITDKLDNKTFSGSSVTLSAAEANSGLTLNSSYTGNGQPTSTLTVTATDQTNNSSSAAQSIAVTDPSSTSATGTSGSGSTGSGSTTTSGSGSSSHGGWGHWGGGHLSDVSQWFNSHPGFAKTAQTLSDAVSSKSGASSAAGSSTDQTASAGNKAFALFNQMMAGDFGNSSHFAQGGSSSAQIQQQTSNQLTRPLH